MAGTLVGRVAVVTAGGSGIGAATARRFAREGVRVLVADLSGRRAEAVATEIASTGARAEWLKMDAADPDGAQAAVRRALDTWGRLDIMVNNAGHAEVAPLDEITIEGWNRVLAVTLTGAFLGMKYCLPVMRRQGGGAIVNTASINALQPGDMQGIYSISKAAVVNMTKAFAKECGRFGIRVNALLPGLTRTKFAGALFETKSIYDDWMGRIPLRRHAEPGEMAGTVLYLVSDASSYTNGECIVVDGGLTI